MAALAAAVHPVPASPPPPARRVVARRAVRTRLAAAAADAVICVFLASMWLICGSLAAMEVGRLAWGEGCPVFVAAPKVLLAAMFTFLLVLLFGVVPLMAPAVGPGPVPGAAADDIEAAKDQAPARKSLAACGALRDAVTLSCLHSSPQRRSSCWRSSVLFWRELTCQGDSLGEDGFGNLCRGSIGPVHGGFLRFLPHFDGEHVEILEDDGTT
ncbi:unnamed protein product [Urochloa humidicola]